MSVRLKSKSRKRRKNNSWLVLLVVSVMLLAGLGIAIHNLSGRAASYSAREKELESLIAAEESRKDYYTEQEKYRQTLKFIEEIARERLNLVFPGEIIVKPND